jgi:protein-disulfide isomerase
VTAAFLILLVLCAAGVGVSHALLADHAAYKYGGKVDDGLCSAADIFSCEAAANSAFSEVLGIPIAAVGMAFYVTVLLLAFAGRAGVKGTRDLVLAGGIAATLYSVMLFIISIAALGHICPKCSILYVINIALLGVAMWDHPQRVAHAVADLARMPKRAVFWGALGVGVVSLGGVMAANAGMVEAAEAAREARMATIQKNEERFEVDGGAAPGKGPKDASVVVVEFSDFECPFCARLTDALREAQKRFPDVRIHFRHYPMDNNCNPAIDRPFHQNACRAAQATVCADRLGGRFWDLHDRMFQQPKNLGRDALVKLAAEIGLDPEAFTACLDDPSSLEPVRADLAAGAKLGVSGTPTFFVNGRRRSGARSADDLVSMFESARKEARAASGEDAPAGQ